MKNNNLMNRFLLSAKIFMIRYLIFNFLFLFIGCTKVKYFDIDNVPDFPPRLSVTALLDGEKGVFNITIMESHSLAFYGQRFELTREIIRNGEIRLYEDGVLIHSQSGLFDMSIDEFRTQRNGYRHIVSGIDTRPGGEYRLVVDVEGYPMVVSTSIMPPALVVSASMNTSTTLIARNIKEIKSVGYGLQNFGNSNNYNSYGHFWPVSAQVSDPDPNAPNYYVLEIFHRHENNHHESGNYNWGIGFPDLMILRDVDMDPAFGQVNVTSNTDLYLFSMLLLGDITFSSENVSRTFYARFLRINDDQDSAFDDDPDFEKVTTNHTIYLRAKHITPATYRYYRSIRQQESINQLFSEPVNVVGNFEGGYGIFSVYNTTSIPLLEWESYEYRKKE